MGGHFGNRGNTESREQTIANGEPLLLQCEILPSERFGPSIPIVSAPCVGPAPDPLLSANRKIQSIASVLRLSDIVSLAATRLYTLAVEHKFTKGRKSLNVIAVCLYVACRQKETRNYMLIDFSDLLQVKPCLTLLLGLNPLVFSGQRIRARTHISPASSDTQSTVAPCRSLPLYLSLRRAPRVW
jgi:hypothetical protein